MSARNPPAVPPRPPRSPRPRQSPSPGIPKIPPRPSRRPDESSSPMRDGHAPSPLNDSPNLSGATSHEASPLNLPARPPNDNISSNSQDALEYTSLDEQNTGGDSEGGSQEQQPAETRNVTHDLYLHAPRPSLPSASAEEKVRTVTGTTTLQAAAAGFGTSASPEPAEPAESDRPNKSMHMRGSSPASTNRPHYSAEEHGIPEIGQRVPMDPDAGDVQAPTPAHDELETPRDTASRTGNSRGASSSYGLRGHGVQPTKFEKAWYDKHPDELAREEEQYNTRFGSPRPEGVMSSEELNTIVRSSADRDAGVGTSEFLGTPEEEVGYIATDELASRLASSPVGSDPQDASKPQALARTPLHQTSFPETTPTKEGGSEETRYAGETEQEEVKIHINEPLHHQHHPDGFAPGPNEHEQHDAKQPGKEEENPDEVPILAADEAIPGAEYMKAAVSPSLEPRSSSPGPEDQERVKSPDSDHDYKPRTLAKIDSREEGHEGNKPEDVKEYEPLFPGGDEQSPPTGGRLGKPSLHQQHKFPSKDVWEDAPESSKLETTVTTPDVPRRPKGEGLPGKSEEDIDHSKMVKRESTDMSSSPKAVETVQQGFPSRDVGEGAPDSQQLETTVQEPEQKRPEGKVTPPDSQRKRSIPAIPTRPSKSITSPSPSPPEGDQAKVTSPATESRKPPAIPERPKPPIPVRPSRPKSRDPETTLTKTTSASSAESTTEVAPKPKPAVPSRPPRPTSNKIASLQEGFLSDLNNRLKLGPKPPPQQGKEEPEEPVEKKPLSDARKGRARGPARRKPAVTKAAPQPAQAAGPAVPEIKLVDAWSAWHVGNDGLLVVGEKGPKTADKAIETPREEVLNSTAAAEILARKESAPEPASEPTSESTPEQAPEPVEPATSTEVPPEELTVPSAAQRFISETPSPKTQPFPSSSAVEVPGDLSLEVEAKPEPEVKVLSEETEPTSEPEAETELKLEPEPNTKPESTVVPETGPESEIESKKIEPEPEPEPKPEPEIVSVPEPEPRPELLPVIEAEEATQEKLKSPSEEERIAPASPQEAVRKASKAVAEEGLDPTKRLSPEEQAARMFP